MALSQNIINVGLAPNDGLGDPIRTAFTKTNNNFTQLFSLPNSTPPGNLIGNVGDIPGMYAYDSSNFYYCFAPYDGVSTIWATAGTTGAASSISNGLSNVAINLANANITLGVNGTSNVGVFSPSGLTVRGTTTSNAVTTGSMTAGNFVVSGDTISSQGELITITPAGNVILGNVAINAAFSILGPTTTTESPVVVLNNSAANATLANASGIQVGSANYSSFLYDSSTDHWSTNSKLRASGIGVLNNGNINGAFNISASNVMAANNIYCANTIDSGFVNSPRVTSNAFVGDGGYLSNIRGANITGLIPSSIYANIANVVADNAQPNITSVGTLTSLAVTGSIFANAVNTTGNINSLSLITAPFIGTAPTTILRGTLSGLSNAQPNITSLGTIAQLNAGNISASGDISCLGNLYAGNIIGNIIATTKFAELVTANNQPNITQVGNLTTLIVDGRLDVGGNIYGNTSSPVDGTLLIHTIFGNNIGSSIYTTLFGKLGINSNAQPNVTSLGTLTTLAVAGASSFANVTANGNVSVNGDLFVTGNISIPGNINQITGNSGSFYGNAVTGFGALYAGVPTGFTSLLQTPFQVATNFDGYSQVNIENINPGPQASGDFVVTADNGDDTNNYVNMGITSSTWDGSNPTSLGNAVGRNDGYLACQGGIGNGGNLIIGTGTVGKAIRFVVGGIGNTNVAVALNGANIDSNSVTSGSMVVTGGIGVSGNVTAAYFNGTATSAQYADLAENYLADAPYEPGTVVSFGGDKEITASTQDLDVFVAGVISTKPAYTMNSALLGDYTVPVALMGRVPCRVTGPVTRGAMMVSNGDGTARAEKNPVMGSVIGKALESFSGGVGVIEIVVGKL